MSLSVMLIAKLPMKFTNVPLVINEVDNHGYMSTQSKYEYAYCKLEWNYLQIYNMNIYNNYRVFVDTFTINCTFVTYNNMQFHQGFTQTLLR